LGIFNTWFIKYILFAHRKIKLLNKWHFVENKTKDYAPGLQNAVHLLAA
jgi:hypothetical protein